LSLNNVQIFVTAREGSSIRDLNFNLSSDMAKKPDPPPPPESSVTAKNQSSVKSIDVASGKSTVSAEDKSVIKGVSVGSAPKADGKHSIREKLGYPLIVAIVVAILGFVVWLAQKRVEANPPWTAGQSDAGSRPDAK
jgi:hypothetical protein